MDIQDKYTDAFKYFTINQPENEEQSMAYFRARQALHKMPALIARVEELERERGICNDCKFANTVGCHCARATWHSTQKGATT